MNAAKRCAITGMGAVAPVGRTVAEVWVAVRDGRCGIGPLTVFDADGFAYARAGQIESAPDAGARDAQGVPLDRASLFMLAAAEEAVVQAGLRERMRNPEDVAVVLATNFGGIERAAELLTEAPSSAAELDRAFREYGFQRCADLVANRFGFRGPRVALSLSCSSGCAAIGYGMSLIRAGRAKAVLAGGYDALTPFCWSGLCALRTMTRDELRPFDKRRNGTIFSEGAGAVLIEEWDEALAAGAVPLAEAAGYGVNNNAHHMTAPAPAGAGSAEVMAMALADAGLSPAAVDHVNAHGTGTRHNDSTETQAIKTVLGDRAHAIPVAANKSVLGHMMGAAGAVESIVAVMTMRDGIVPPTIGYGEPDPACDLDYVPNVRREFPVRVALSNSAGIGGCNAAVVLTAV